MGFCSVIVGGESGAAPRMFDLTWARELLQQCREADVPVFIKQMGALSQDAPGVPLVCKDSHGGEMDEWPEDVRIRQFPRPSLPLRVR